MPNSAPAPTAVPAATPQNTTANIIANYKANNAGSPSVASPVSSNSWYSQMKAGTFSAPTTADTTEAPQPKGDNPIVGLAKDIISPVATLAARPLQAGAELLGASDKQVNDVSDKLSGGLVAPVPENGADFEKDLGRGAETVALGLGPVAGGAAFGGGASLEQGNDLLSPTTAVDTVLGLAGGKLLDVAGKPIFNAVGKVVAKVTPELLSDIASRGAVAISDFAKAHNILPAQVSHVINEAAGMADKVANKPFSAALDAAKATVAPIKGAKENFQASRGDANNRGLAAPAQRLADQAPLIGAGAAREAKPTDVYNEAVRDSNAHLNDPTKVDKPIEKFGQNEVSSAFDQVVKQRQAAGKAMGDALKDSNVGKIKTNIATAKQKLITSLSKDQKLIYTPETGTDGKPIIGKGKLQANGQSPMGKTDQHMVENYIKDLDTLDNNPTVADVDAFIRRTTADLDLYKQTNQITGTTNGERIIKQNLSDLRNTISAKATKNPALKPYSDAKAEFARLSPLVERGVSLLGKSDLEGGYVKDASIAKRAIQSITNGGTKDFMKGLEKETGKPLLDKAYLILQAMKDTGDTSAHSLLDMFGKDAADGKLPSPETILGKIQQWMIKHAETKIAGTPVEQTQAMLKAIENAKKTK